MAIFKCKMCGGDLEVTEGMNVCECEYCGTKQTVPNSDDEKKINLFNRANRLRLANEFDKASGIFESIIAEFPEEAEAYWGLCLCKYGIEYVDDPATAKKIPTCHRTSYDSIFDDNNFEMALEYADTESIRIYREEAKEIDRLQKSILEIAQKEEPFDVFICYKETDEKGQRTKDSVLAQDMYDALTEKGYKVFFSRITLEDKLGQEFEPYIFSALNSAKVMLTVGTKYEYFHAVWVKNEWSRFLDLMQGDKSKVLIPCYCDIDAYDMPTEFKNLQGQDMSKIGFMQDLIRGIEKITSKSKNEYASPIQQYNYVNVDNLIKRAYIFLSDQDLKNAKQIADRILDIEVDNAQAYIIDLMCELSITNESQLKEHDVPLNQYVKFNRALKVAKGEYKDLLQKYLIQSTENYCVHICELLKYSKFPKDIIKIQEALKDIPNCDKKNILEEKIKELNDKIEELKPKNEKIIITAKNDLISKIQMEKNLILSLTDEMDSGGKKCLIVTIVLFVIVFIQQWVATGFMGGVIMGGLVLIIGIAISRSLHSSTEKSVLNRIRKHEQYMLEETEKIINGLNYRQQLTLITQIADDEKKVVCQALDKNNSEQNSLYEFLNNKGKLNATIKDLEFQEVFDKAYNSVFENC